MDRKKPKVELLKLGEVGYQEAWDLQTEYFNKEVERKISNKKLDQKQPAINRLILLQHPHVYTLGKSGSSNNLIMSAEERDEKGVKYIETNRGGDITYHGPGQILGYPLLDLDEFKADIHWYMRSLEDVIINTLAHYGIEGHHYNKFTGVWLEPNTIRERKICAMGVKTSRWITMHGWALNVHPDLSFFKGIIPCGIDDKAVTSIEQELGQAPDLTEVEEVLSSQFEKVFDCELIPHKY